MSMFTTVQWDSNPIIDKTCQDLFKNIKSKQKSKNKNEKKKLKIKRGRIEKAKIKKNVNIQNVHNFKEADQTNVTKKKYTKKSKLSDTNKSQTLKPQHLNVANKQRNNKGDTSIIENIPQEFKRKKNKITHQTLFLNNPKHKKNFSQNKNETKKLKAKQLNKFDFINPNADSKSTPYRKSTLLPNNRRGSKHKPLSLRERMLEKLKGARFRYINEHLYTNLGKDSKIYFEKNPDAYTAYHEGYQQQVERWPLNPLDVIVEKIKKLPKSHVIADFGCGEATLAKSVQQTVFSFDLVALNDSVTACDMSHVPLENNSVDVAVFCLSLMGTNLKEYLLEANRVLKVGGLLKIAEVESRFENIDLFIKGLQSFGFTKKTKDFSHNLFCFLDFIKKGISVKNKNKLPNVKLEPCLYKRR